MFPSNAAAARRSAAAQSGMSSTPVPTSSPMVNSSVSPGRKNPTSKPHSAKMIAAAIHGAVAPNASRWRGSSQDGPSAGRAASAVVAAPVEVTRPGYGRPAYGVLVDDLTVGVGPWSGPWPDDPRYDPELLQQGDRRNVVD